MLAVSTVVGLIFQAVAVVVVDILEAAAVPVVTIMVLVPETDQAVVVDLRTPTPAMLLVLHIRKVITRAVLR